MTTLWHTFYKAVRPVASLTGIVTGLVTVVATVAVFHRLIAAWKIRGKKLPRRKESVEGVYTERPKLQKDLLSAIDNPDPMTVLVYGERGAGKTTLIEHVLENRQGVILVKIGNFDELVAKLSEEICVFKLPRTQAYIEDVFARCSVHNPVIVVCMDPSCDRDTLHGIIITARQLGWDNRSKPNHARIVVELSGSRAAMEQARSFIKNRVLPIYVGPFSEEEETKDFVKERLAKLPFRDPRQQEAVAASVVDKFPWNALELGRVCATLKKQYNPTDQDPNLVDGILNRIREDYEREAWSAWLIFVQKLEERIDGSLGERHKLRFVHLLLEGPQPADRIIDVVRNDATRQITVIDLGVANANTSYHPLLIDPFHTMISISDKIFRSVFMARFAAPEVDNSDNG